jgi:hypothetical protein
VEQVVRLVHQVHLELVEHLALQESQAHQEQVERQVPLVHQVVQEQVVRVVQVEHQVLREQVVKVEFPLDRYITSMNRKIQTFQGIRF